MSQRHPEFTKGVHLAPRTTPTTYEVYIENRGKTQTLWGGSSAEKPHQSDMFLPKSATPNVASLYEIPKTALNHAEWSPMSDSGTY